MAKNEKTNNKEVSKNKRSFMKDFKAELKKVVWPTPKQLVNNTVAVITIVLLTAVIVFALDFVFEKINSHGINKIKEAITSLDVTDDDSAENTTTDDNTTENSSNTTESDTEANTTETDAETNTTETDTTDTAETEGTETNTVEATNGADEANTTAE